MEEKKGKPLEEFLLSKSNEQLKAEIVPSRLSPLQAMRKRFVPQNRNQNPIISLKQKNVQRFRYYCLDAAFVAHRPIRPDGSN